MPGTGMPQIHELLLSAMEQFHKKHSLCTVIVNAPQRRIIPCLGRAELGAVHLRMPPEMKPQLWRVFRERSKRRTHGVQLGSVSYVLLEKPLNVDKSRPS